MDTAHFDAITRRLGTRRTALGGALAGLLLPLSAAARKKGHGKDNHRHRHGKGKDRTKGNGKHRATAQADSCWRAGACLLKKGANVSQCNLAGYSAPDDLNCTGCNLSRTNLRDADLTGVNFTKANLSGACLIDADFTGATFADNTNLANAIFCNTTMPNGSVNNSNCGRGTACCLSCPASETMCSDSCVDLQTDARNCGSCGHACGGGQSCVNGSCQTRPRTVTLSWIQWFSDNVCWGCVPSVSVTGFSPGPHVAYVGFQFVFTIDVDANGNGTGTPRDSVVQSDPYDYVATVDGVTSAPVSGDCCATT